MKKSSSFYNFVKKLNQKEEEKIINFKSMKDFFHYPSKYIKSENLLSYSISPKKLDSNNKEYSVILTNKKKQLENITNIIYEPKYIYNYQKNLNYNKNIPKITNMKNQESSESSFNNYNYKVGLNAPLSYNDISYNNSYTEFNEKPKINLKENNNKRINCNLLNEIHKNKLSNKIKSENNKILDYNIFLNVDTKKNLDLNNKEDNNNTSKKLKNDININRFNKEILYKKPNKNYSEIYKIRPKLNRSKTHNNKDEKSNINIEKKAINKPNLNNNNAKIKKLNKSPLNKNDNQGIFEKILIDLKYVKSAINKNSKHIIYNISNSKNYIKINNEYEKPKSHLNTPIINQNRNLKKFPEINESKQTSNSISLDFNDINSSRMKNNNIKIRNTYNLAKKCTSKKNKLLKMNYIKSILLNEENKKMEEIENKNNEEKNNIENIENINSESISYKSSSRAKNSSKDEKKDQNNIEKFDSENEEIIDKEKDVTTSTPKNTNNKNYLLKIIESRKQLTKNLEHKFEKPGINLYKRSQIYKANKELKTENLRRKLKEKENSEIQLKPKIDNKSKRLAKYNLPIYERLDYIEMKKQSGIQKIKNLIIKENEINETTINQKCEKYFDKNKFDKWLSSNDKWNKQKNYKVNKIKEKLNQQKLKDENFKFKPTIDKNSEKLFNKNKKLSKSPVTDRLFQKNNNKELLIKKEEMKRNLSFIPEINKEYKIRNQYYNFMEEDQAELYNELKDQVEKIEKKI